MNVLDPMPINGFSPLDEGSNCIFLPYCDGASFSGYKEEPVMVSGQPIHFRGLENFDSTLDYAFANLGLKDASELVVTGG